MDRERRPPFLSDFRAALRATLSCPKCPAENRPGASIIDLDETGARAYCGVCSHEGPLLNFRKSTV